MTTLTEPIRLRCVSTDTVVVTFKDGLQGKPTFSEDYEHLEEAMKVVGIAIPFYDQDKYLINDQNKKSKKRAVYLDDAKFGQAFYEVYFTANMDPTKFVWEKISS